MLAALAVEKAITFLEAEVEDAVEAEAEGVDAEEAVPRHLQLHNGTMSISRAILEVIISLASVERSETI